MTELDDFFSKKASKSKKKSNFINVDILGQKLERNVKLQVQFIFYINYNNVLYFQEELDEKEALEPTSDDLNVSRDIDSEWIDPNVSGATNLEELGIMDMATSGLTDDDESDHEKIENEPVKTWNTAQVFSIAKFQNDTEISET